MPLWLRVELRRAAALRAMAVWVGRCLPVAGMPSGSLNRSATLSMIVDSMLRRREVNRSAKSSSWVGSKSAGSNSAGSSGAGCGGTVRNFVPWREG